MLTYNQCEEIRKKRLTGALSDEERKAAIGALEQHIKDDPYPSNEDVQLLVSLRGGPDPRNIGWRRGGDWSLQRDRETDD